MTAECVRVDVGLGDMCAAVGAVRSGCTLAESLPAQDAEHGCSHLGVSTHTLTSALRKRSQVICLLFP